MDTLRYLLEEMEADWFCMFFHALFFNGWSCNTGTSQSVQMIKVESVLLFF